MTNKQAIYQLEGLKEYCELMSKDEYTDIWDSDVSALEIAIQILSEKEIRHGQE